MGFLREHRNFPLLNSLTTKKAWLIILFVIISLVLLLIAKKVLAQSIPTSIQQSAYQIATSTLEKQPDKLRLKTVESLVREEFSDIPIMIEVARCESHFRQFKGGEVLRGVENPLDRGIFQINEKYHLENSKKLGIDIYTIEGNMAYGRYLYNQSKLQSWKASEYCWNK